jgi:hypothetical protein
MTPSPTSALSLLFAVLLDASEAWRGLRMRGEIVASLKQLAADPHSTRHDPELARIGSFPMLKPSSRMLGSCSHKAEQTHNRVNASGLAFYSGLSRGAGTSSPSPFPA